MYTQSISLYRDLFLQDSARCVCNIEITSISCVDNVILYVMI